MTFLNPFVLFGLAAAAIPIILHLLNLRKLRTIEFSTLTFLKELQKSTMRKIKIRQWLLLVLRTMLVLLIVLAFSRPALKGSFAGMGGHAKTTIVIILDNTYSMSLGNERGTYLKQAQAVARGLTDLLKEGDDAFLIRLSDVPLPTTAEPTHDVAVLQNLITQTQLSYKHRTIEDALRLASRLLQQSKNFNKEIYLLTNGQRSTLADESADAQSKRRALAAGPLEKIFVVPLAEKSFDNVAVDNVSIPSSLLQRGKPFSVRATIQNFGRSALENSVASVYLDGARVMQKNISLNSGASAVADFSVVPQRTGFIPGYVEMEGDAYDADNRFYFSIYIPSRLRVLLVSSNPSSENYLRLALSAPSESDSTGTQSYIALRETEPIHLTTSLIQNADVVILSHVTSVSQPEADMLSGFLSDKEGGIIFFPGDGMHIDEYNSVLFSTLGLPQLQPVVSIPKSSGGFVSFEKVDYDHPVFQGMFESPAHIDNGNKSKIESPQITSFVRFASGTPNGLRSIISLSNGASFLWEKISGSGRVMGFAVTDDNAWSNFPVKGIFVPLIYQTILYASSGGKISPLNATVGEKLDIPIAGFGRTGIAGSPTLRIVDPNKKETLLQPYWTAGRGASRAFISLDETPVPGAYNALQNRDTLAQIPVNVDIAGSDGTIATDHDIYDAMKHSGIPENSVSLVHHAENLHNLVLQSRYGIELWRYFLIAALLVALVETAVAREPRQER